MAKKKDLEGQLAAFVQQYARKAYPNIDPNDRRYDRKMEEIAKRMDPIEFDRLVHGAEDEDLDKSPALFDLLMHLRDILGTGSFQIVDHWEADRLMVGVAHPSDHRVLACLSLRDEPERYNVHLELPAAPGSRPPYIDAGIFEGLKLPDVAEVVRNHLLRGEAR
jgi:hypothetical protein